MVLRGREKSSIEYCRYYWLSKATKDPIFLSRNDTIIARQNADIQHLLRIHEVFWQVVRNHSNFMFDQQYCKRGNPEWNSSFRRMCVQFVYSLTTGARPYLNTCNIQGWDSPEFSFDLNQFCLLKLKVISSKKILQIATCKVAGCQKRRGYILKTNYTH